MSNKFPHVDFQLMDEMSQQQAIAELVVSQGQHWQEVGRARGRADAAREHKFNSWIAVLVAFILGALLGACPF